jgi:hypothetical protein
VLDPCSAPRREDFQVEASEALDLRMTFRGDAIQQDEPLTIHDTGATGSDDHPASELDGITCYHGSTIHVGDDL